MSKSFKDRILDAVENLEKAHGDDEFLIEMITEPANKGMTVYLDKLPRKLDVTSVAEFLRAGDKHTRMEIRPSAEYVDHLSIVADFQTADHKPTSSSAQTSEKEVAVPEVDLSEYDLLPREMETLRTLMHGFHNYLGVHQSRMSYYVETEPELTLCLCELDYINFISFARFLLAHRNAAKCTIALSSDQTLLVEIKVPPAGASSKRMREASDDPEEANAKRARVLEVHEVVDIL